MEKSQRNAISVNQFMINCIIFAGTIGCCWWRRGCNSKDKIFVRIGFTLDQFWFATTSFFSFKLSTIWCFQRVVLDEVTWYLWTKFKTFEELLFLKLYKFRWVWGRRWVLAGSRRIGGRRGGWWSGDYGPAGHKGNWTPLQRPLGQAIIMNNTDNTPPSQ